MRQRVLTGCGLMAIALSAALQVVVVYTPGLDEAFATDPLSPWDWVLAIALASSVLWVSELRKLLLRRRASV